MFKRSVNVLKVFVNNSHLLSEKFAFDFLTIQNTFVGKNDEGINHLFNRIHSHDLLAITGINASGKTTVLKTLIAIFRFYLRSDNLNSFDEEEYRCILRDGMSFGMYFCDDKNIYRIETQIGKEKHVFQNAWIIKDEFLSLKPISTKISRNNIFDNNYSTITRRSTLSEEKTEYLSKDISIAKSIMDKKHHTFVVNSLPMTNFNYISNFGFLNNEYENVSSLPTSLLKYLDASIESIRMEETESNDIYSIKFYGDDRVYQVKNIVDLQNYLSSGTIKGISIFPYISLILRFGGYLFIDEIEMHLNKAIVQSIIEIFRDRSINKNHAVLVFSTHYSELLDCLDRNDSVIIAHKDERMKISIFNMAESLTRNDLKKSEVYVTDYLEKGTAPSYSSYMEFVKGIDQILLTGDQENE